MSLAGFALDSGSMLLLPLTDFIMLIHDRLLMGVLPTDRTAWKKEMTKQRDAYYVRLRILLFRWVLNLL